MAGAIEELTSNVVDKAEEIGRNPGNKKSKEELNHLRQEWSRKVQELTRILDYVIDPEEFMSLSGEEES